MQNILIISTGGTFNKVYNKITGNLDIDKESSSIGVISKKWMSNLNYINIIGKDSLDFTNEDRELLLETIKNSTCDKIVIIHGTDTIDLSSKYIAKHINNKSILFTGSMVPFSIENIEATANLSFALGAIQFIENGVYIAINGKIASFDKIKKDRSKGEFLVIGD